MAEQSETEKLQRLRQAMQITQRNKLKSIQKIARNSIIYDEIEMTDDQINHFIRYLNYVYKYLHFQDANIDSHIRYMRFMKNPMCVFLEPSVVIASHAESKARRENIDLLTGNLKKGIVEMFNIPDRDVRKNCIKIVKDIIEYHKENKDEFTTLEKEQEEAFYRYCEDEMEKDFPLSSVAENNLHLLQQFFSFYLNHPAIKFSDVVKDEMTPDKMKSAKRYFFLPINHNNHWVLCVVDWYFCSIYLMDSIFAEDEEVRKSTQAFYFNFVQEMFQFPKKSSRHTVKVDAQKNCFDCGFKVCSNMIFFLRMILRFHDIHDRRDKLSNDSILQFVKQSAEHNFTIIPPVTLRKLICNAHLVDVIDDSLGEIQPNEDLLSFILVHLTEGIEDLKEMHEQLKKRAIKIPSTTVICSETKKCMDQRHLVNLTKSILFTRCPQSAGNRNDDDDD